MTVPQDLATVASKLGLVTSVSRASDGSPVPEHDEEQFVSQVTPVALRFGSSLNVGSGTLFISTSRVIWASSSQPLVLALRYQQIVMHAISREGTEAGSKACLYLQLDEAEEMQTGDEEEEEEEEEVEPEMWLVPEEEAKVDEVFKALCDCAALNPDPEEEGEGDFFFNEEEVMAGLDDETRAAVVAHQTAGMDLDDLVGDDPSRFEDEDGGEEEEEGGAPAGAGVNGAQH